VLPTVFFYNSYLESKSITLHLILAILSEYFGQIKEVIDISGKVAILIALVPTLIRSHPFY